MHSWPKFAQHPNSNSSEVLVLRFGLLTWDPHIDIVVLVDRHTKSSPNKFRKLLIKFQDVNARF